MPQERLGQEVEFLHEFIAASREVRQEGGREEEWKELRDNWMVRPPSYGGAAYDRSNPFGIPGHGARDSGYSVLKDSESHQIVQTLLAGTMTTVFGEPNYVQTKPVGLEDVYRASTLSRILERDFSLPGHFSAMYGWGSGGYTVGTGIVFAGWDYAEGYSFRDGSSMPEVEHDDPRIETLDPMDCFPDPGAYRSERMIGFARRLRLTPREARRMKQWNQAEVERAIADSDAGTGQQTSEQGEDEELWSAGHHFRDLWGYQYWGEVPWGSEETCWRKFTVLRGRLVENVQWPLMRRRVPFFEFTPLPVERSFWGMSPLSVSRYDQDLADTLKMMIADAAVRMTHPQALVHRDSGIKAAQFQQFRPNNPIFTDNMDGAAYLKYAADIGQTAGVLQWTKQSMRERTGANDVQQGLPFGTKRLSGTEAAVVAQNAGLGQRLTGMLLEREYLPALGRHLAEMDQMFLADDPQAVARRIGEIPGPWPLADLVLDHDVRFVGSQMMHSKQDRLALLERTAQVIAQTPGAAMFPWGLYLSIWMREADQAELELAVGDPETVVTNIMLMGAQNGGQGGGMRPISQQTVPPQASGMLPAQVAGGLPGA